MRLLKLLLILFACAAGPALAGQFEDGVAAYEKGDTATAQRLLRPLADQGKAEAQNILGDMYAQGWILTRIPRDYSGAATWYKRAAEQGEAQAQYSLGVMYYKGQGVPQDYVQAYMLLNLAAVRFDTSKQERRDRAARNRDTAAAKMTSAQIAEAQKLVREWKPKPEQ